MRLSSDLHQELVVARSQTDQLFDLLDPAALYDRPIAERNRIIFYLGHLEAFDWNQLARRCLNLPSFHPAFDTLFERGIDPEPGQLPSDQPKDWPSIAEVQSYSNRVREKLDSLWEETPAERRQMVVEHRQMHAETFTYMLHNLAPDKKRPQPEGKLPGFEPAQQHQEPMVTVPAGHATLGQARNGEFGWDNEFKETRIFVPEFRIMKYKVTNREYLDYVREGGSPSHFWEQNGKEWLYRGMFGLAPLPFDAPVYVTRDQALGYASWKGMSLPSEAQYHRAAFGAPDVERTSLPRGNRDFQFWDPVPVNATPEDVSAWGVVQLGGNGWEWTSTAFGPFEGFQPAAYYPGYSADFFDGRHYVVKGASSRTADLLTRRSFRNWYRSEYPYTYTGFRLVEN